MKLTGLNYIAGMPSGEGNERFAAVNPETVEEITPRFFTAMEEEVGLAIEEAQKAFFVYRKITPEKKAVFLEAIADEIMALGDDLVERCCTETGLPPGRITGERGRTVNQLRLFAEVVREGSWVDARIDHALPDRSPVPKPDVRSMLQPLGPVGIFGASNFPLAFSVAGGDTASALASGCPVVVKAHPSHPGTCELIARAIYSALDKCGLPAGVFSLLQGNSNAVGMAIVKHPMIQAIGFTGSFRGGKAIFDAANQRPVPIPVYAEMGSTNPVFVLPGAIKERGEEIARGLSNSVTLGSGQFCTNPGLVFLGEGVETDAFADKVSGFIREVDAQTMLNSGIKSSFQAGLEKLQAQSVELLAKGKETSTGLSGTAHVFRTTADHFLQNAQLEEENFGPSSILVASDQRDILLESARRLGGHLTASVFGTEEDLRIYRDLLDILEFKVGRLIINQFPTGVEVCPSMVHGGPFPATTDSRTTSVGTRAITRFARPVCYQNFPQELLPEELKDGNPAALTRMVDGHMVVGK